MTTIVNDDSIYVYFDVSANDLLAPKRSREQRKNTTSRPAKFDVPAYLALADEVGYPHGGRVDFADTRLDTSTGTISVRAVLPNANEELLPGLFARVRVPVCKPRQVFMVSEPALGSDQGQRYLLVGLASKNAILIVEFAKSRREAGVARGEATVEAGRLRLRPTLMTSLAFILGILPLVLSEGAGAEMRRTLGTAVFSGMLGVTFFGIFLTPVFYYVIQAVADWRHSRTEDARSGEAQGLSPDGAHAAVESSGD